MVFITAVFGSMHIEWLLRKDILLHTLLVIRDLYLLLNVLHVDGMRAQSLTLRSVQQVALRRRLLIILNLIHWLALVAFDADAVLGLELLLADLALYLDLVDVLVFEEFGAEHFFVLLEPCLVVK